MARMNISVSDNLKARMDAVEEPVNWSAIASRAFEIELGEVAERKEEKDMSAVIDRLRASKLVDEGQEYKVGHTAGKSWVESSADYRALENLAAWSEDENWGMDEWPIADRLYVEATGVDEYNQKDCYEFWESVAGIENAKKLTDEFATGFCEGALETFNQVRDAI